MTSKIGNALAKALWDGGSSAFAKLPKSDPGNVASAATEHAGGIEKLDLSRLSILLIDDNKFIRRLVTEILRSFGVKMIHEADSASSALGQMAIRGKFDLIICDWSMEPKDGLWVLRAVRGGKTPLSPRVPFVILTGECRENKVVEALAEGASSYIVKPISAGLLMNHLVKLIIDDKEKYELD